MFYHPSPPLSKKDKRELEIVFKLAREWQRIRASIANEGRPKSLSRGNVKALLYQRLLKNKDKHKNKQLCENFIPWSREFTNSIR